MKLKSLILSTILLSCSTTVVNAQQGWSATTNLNQLRVFNGTIIYGQAVSLNQVGRCNGVNATGNGFQLDTESPFFEETYSILLTAQATGRRVQLYRSGECAGAQFPIVNGARLFN